MSEISDLEFVWEATGGDISQEGVFTAGNDPGSFEVGVSATFKDSTRKAVASVPLPPVWISTGAMANWHSAHIAARLPDGKVLMVGGAESADIYDPTSRSFTSLDITPCIHKRFSAGTTLADGKILITGGRSDPRCVEIFDPVAGEFSRVGDMGTDHWEHSVTLLADGRALVAGGYQLLADGDSATHAVAELYDPATKAFSPVESLNEDRMAHAAVLLPTGKVMVAAGEKARLEDGKFVLGSCRKSVELYDPLTGVFDMIDGLRFSACSVLATLLGDGDVLITRNRRAEIFDYGTGKFRVQGIMTVLRGEPTATLLSNGQVLITGGYTEEAEAVPTAEIYDPNTGTFSPIQDMSVARQQHTATLLSNGWVLVAGGHLNRAQKSAELFIPSTLP